METGVTAYSTLYGNIGGAKVKASYQGIYAQDTWEVSQGLRLFYGLRAETQEWEQTTALMDRFIAAKAEDLA